MINKHIDPKDELIKSTLRKIDGDKVYREILDNQNCDLMLEVKGIITLIYSAVIRLEDAYKFGNHDKKQEQLSLFKKYKQFFIGQVESDVFTDSQRLELYKDMYDVCRKILRHECDYYRMNRTIVSATNHYLIRILERIMKLEEICK